MSKDTPGVSSPDMSDLDNTKGSNSGASSHLEKAIAPGQQQLESCELLDPRNPRNWPKWKKNTQILMVAFHSMVATFMAAGIIPAYEAMAEEYGVTVPEASYLTSIQACLPCPHHAGSDNR